MSESTSNVDPDDTLQCFIELTEIREQKIKLGKKEKTTKTGWEAKGVDVEAVHATIMLNRKDSPTMWMARLRRTAQIAGVLPVVEEANGQMSMVLPSQSAQERKANQAAFWSGHDSGASGGLLDANPHKTGSEEFVSWRDGWSDGMVDKEANDEAVAARKARKKEDKDQAQNATEAPTDVRKRGRPPGAGRKAAGQKGPGRKAAGKKAASDQPAAE